ncbi:hypothetical protein EDF35_4076 [Rathayibacter sp. PhB151]|nr:hypothetical protein EDF35_4076 [Rathayibacter sp. PhB151]
MPAFEVPTRLRVLRATMLIASGVALAASAVATPAVADPTGCQTWASDGTGYALCNSGDGAYRVTTVCHTLFGNAYNYGPYVTVGNISQASCAEGSTFKYVGINKPGNR